MVIEHTYYKSDNGREWFFRSPKEDEAGEFIRYLEDIANESEFLLYNPDETDFDEEFEREFINNANSAEKSFLLAAYTLDNKLAGLLGITSKGQAFKIEHRAELSIAVKKEFWNQGLGSGMIKKALEICSQNKIELVELEAFATNKKAIALYEKLGFEKTGEVKRAFKLKDGSYVDEVSMVYYI